MIKIVLVEDEPSAMRHISTVINTKCQGFEIVGSAENGADGLELVRLNKPDILITDIKMPVMDGIRLVSLIKDEFPFIYSIIISGYQDFEYAKGAIKSGVVDYLLKPVNIVQLKDLLDSIKEKLTGHYYTECTSIIRQILNGEKIEEWRMARYLPYKLYNIALLRANGLPSRFSANQFSAGYNPAIDIFSYIRERGGRYSWVITGRDNMELVFFHSCDNEESISFEELVNDAARKFGGYYHNIVFSKELTSLLSCKNIIGSMYRIIDNNTVIGVSQVLNTTDMLETPDKCTNLNDSFLGRIKFYLSNAQYDDLKEEFIKLFTSWEKEERKQLLIECDLRQILKIIEKNSPSNNGINAQKIEFMLDEAFFYAASFGELMTNTWEIVEKLVHRKEVRNQKMDNLDFFISIESYMERNLSQPLSLQSTCAVFGISQAYFSRLFRKFKNMSFNECLTNMRVQKARQLLEEHPEIHIKNVAEMVGYNDQFYFSRVFRSVTGVPPSEYNHNDREI